jgi:glycosyltransferase involved in cell wall biosynthesis
MKTIHTVGTYFPDVCGGIEVSLQNLLRGLRTYGVEAKIAAAKPSFQAETYTFDGVEIYRYPVLPLPKMEPIYGVEPHGNFESFSGWLRSQTADIYHQHQWVPTCGLHHLRLAKELGMSTVVTIHLAHPLCKRLSMMLNGVQPCDGRIDEIRCSRCTASASQSIPAPALKILANLPINLLNRVSLPANLYAPTDENASGLGQRIRAAVIPAYIKARRDGLLQMAKYADRIIVVSQWLYDSFLINNIPEEKLFLCRHGMPENLQAHAASSRPQNEALTIGFLGRWDPFKGVHIIVEALKLIPQEIPLKLLIYGVNQDQKYQKEIAAYSATDSRIQILQSLSREEIPTALANLDILAVPSQGYETGPLVVLESFACGTPVIGSNVGGIAELVRNQVDGYLVPPSEPKAWAEALQQLALQPERLTQLRANIRPVRTSAIEAAEMVKLYERIVGPLEK